MIFYIFRVGIYKYQVTQNKFDLINTTTKGNKYPYFNMLGTYAEELISFSNNFIIW